MKTIEKSSTSSGWLHRMFPPPKLLSMPAVGVDISDSSIRFLELLETNGGKRVGRYATQDVSEGIIVDGKIERTEELTKILETFRKKHGVGTVHVALPEEHVYLFQAVIPAGKSDKEIRTAIEFQIGENVPVPPNNAIFDYEIINDRGEEWYVNIVVYPRDVIVPYVEALYRARLTPLSFEVEAQSLARSVTPHDGKTYMIVDFGRRRTGIAIVSNGTLRFTTAVTVGGDALTVAIKKQFSVDEKKADEIKNERGLHRSEENKSLVELLLPTISALRDEVNRYLVYWNTHTSEHEKLDKITKIICCGGSSNLAGLADYLSFSLDAPVEIGNVWRNVFSIESTVPPIQKRSSLGYATAIGLSLRDFE